MALLEFSITPLGAGESVSEYVARAVDLIDKSGLDYRLHAMGTVVEGEIGPLLDLLKKCIEAMTHRRARRQGGQRRETTGTCGEEVGWHACCATGPLAGGRRCAL
jgi:uncharacterized protein (TIGR00106 family)